MVEEKEAVKARNVFFKTGLSIIVFGVTFFAAFLSSSHFMPISKSSAETTGDYYANITNTGAIDIDLVATPDGYGKVGKDTLSISTNATSGYKLYLSTASTAPNNSLYLSTDSTKGITATTGSMSTPSKLAPNTWGYVPSRSNPSDTVASYTDAAADADNGDAVFIGVPEYGDENVIYTNDTPTVSGSNSVDIYYGVNASTALPSGEYSNTVVYTAIVDAVNPSSKDASISPASQEGLDAGTEVTISTSLYPGFSADNLGNITITIGGNACTNVTPSVAEAGNLNITCTAPAASAAGKYDVVVNVAKYNKTYTLTEGYEYIAIDYMQDFSAAAHSSDATGTTYTLTDSRDKTEYQARKLADGNIWMTQNLRLVGSKTLTPADSNVTTNFTLTASDSSAWCKQNSSSCDDQSMVLDSGDTSYGVYYNWYAATAGSGKYETSGTASASICPKGWRLPTDTEFQTLYDNYNSPSAMSDTNGPAFVLSGYRNGGSTSNQGSNGYYWSSVAASNSYAYRLYLESSSVSSQSSGTKWRGSTVRCIADKTALSDITSMQEMTSAVVANTPAEYSKTLTDTRGGSYTVTKLADGNIWMTQNLNLYNKTLTPEDSDVSSNFTIPNSSTANWCTTNSAACDDQAMTLDSGNASYGTYYNWYTATAGTGTYEMTSGNATSSICPKGWRLPTSTEFNTMYNQYGSSASLQATGAGQPAFVLSGNRNGSSTRYQGSYGYYWSSTASNSNRAYRLNLDSSSVYPQNVSSKYFGFSVRCVAAS